jgi:hypothetical protein
MKKLILVIVCLLMAGCGPIIQIKRAVLPIMYDNATISIVTENALLFPKMENKDFMPLFATRLKEYTKTEIAKQGNLQIISACKPRTLKVTQEITGVTVNSSTDVSTGFFLFQLIRGSANSTKKDMININTTTTVADCESGKILGVYDYQSNGDNPVNILQYIAFYNVYYIYAHLHDKN